MNLPAANSRWFPPLGWPRLTRQSLKLDAAAAFTGAVLVLPQGLAFAAIAGLPPHYGLYAAMVPTVVAALWGSSWHLVSGPTTAISIIVFASVSPAAQPGTPHYIGLVLTLTLLVGLFQLAMGLARLGALVNFISHTVIVGFTAGAALLIAASQLGNFFGLAVPRGLDFLGTLAFASEHVREAHLWVALVGLVTVGCGIAVRRYLPTWPYMIIAMIAGSIVAAVLQELLGAQRTQIATVGAISVTLPPFSIPDLSFSAIKTMLFPAFIVTVLALTEAVAISRSIAVRSGQHIDSNREFIGQGLSNIAGAFFSAYTSSGSFNRSGANYASGARTPLAAALSALFLLIIALVAAPLIVFVPIAAIAAILFIVAWALIDWHQIGEIVHHHPQERIILLLTFGGTLVDLEKGLFLGVVTSLLFYLYRTSQPAIEEVSLRNSEVGDPARKFVPVSASAPSCPQMAILNAQGSIYFGAVEHVRNRLNLLATDHARGKWLLLLARRVEFIDLAGAHLLADEARRRVARGGGLWIVGAPDGVQHLLSHDGDAQAEHPIRFFAHKGDALRTIYPQLDSDICRQCSVRAFTECRSHLPNGEAREPPPPPPEESPDA